MSSDAAERYSIQGDHSTLAWSPDGRTLASTWVVEDQDFFCFLRITTLSPFHEQVIALQAPLEGSLVLDLVWDADSASFFMAGNRRISRYWLEGSHLQVLLHQPNKTHQALAYNPPQQQIAAQISKLGGTMLDEPPYGITLYHLTDLSSPHSVDAHTDFGVLHPLYAEQMKWSPDGRYFAAADFFKPIIVVWETESWTRVYQHQADSRIQSIHWLRDSRQLIIYERTDMKAGKLWAVEVDTQQVLWSVPASIQDIHVIEHEGKEHLAYRRGRDVHFMKVGRPETTQSLDLQLDLNQYISRVAVAQDGTHLAYVTSFQTYDEILPPRIVEIDPAMYTP